MDKYKELKEKYGCNGDCYRDDGMCPMVDRCPETRNREFAATIGAFLLTKLLPIVAVAVSAWIIIFKVIKV